MATTTQKPKTAKPQANTEEKITAAPSVKEETAEQKKPVAKEIDQTQLVTVRNGFRGRLVYISARTGEKFEWGEYGDEQEMELRELKSVKASAKKFFEENWFLLDEWVIRYLGVESFYKHALSPDTFDEIFLKSPEEIKADISEMSRGQRDSVAYRAKELISDGKVDSLKVIAALEEALGIDLIEK